MLYSFLAVPFGFILELPSSALCLTLREVNFKSSPQLLPAALRLPPNRGVASVITAKPPPFPPCTIPGWLLLSEASEITQTSGEPRREQSAANTRLNPLPPETEAHAWIPQWGSILLSYVSKISAGEYLCGPGGEEQPKPAGWSRGWCWCLGTDSLREPGKQKLSWGTSFLIPMWAMKWAALKWRALSSSPFHPPAWTHISL